MPHQMANKRLSRTHGPRQALLRSLATSFFLHEKIETTSTKAKEVSKIVERLITQARRGDLHSRRLVAAYLLDPRVVKKLVDQIAPALKDRTGGYTRITKIARAPRRRRRTLDPRTGKIAADSIAKGGCDRIRRR